MADKRKVLSHSAEQIDEAVEKVLDGTVATKTDLQKKADTSSVYNKEESISASTRTALSLPETATPDAALAEIARQLSESGGVSMTLLWENASPASTIAAQTISIDTSTYDRICVFCSSNVNYPNNEVFCIVRIGKTGTATIVSGGSPHIRSRQITNNGASGVYIDDAWQLTNMSTSEVNNTFVRPVAIYGMKLA